VFSGAEYESFVLDRRRVLANRVRAADHTVVVIMGATDYVSDGTQHAAKCNDPGHLPAEICDAPQGMDRFRLTRFARIPQD